MRWARPAWLRLGLVVAFGLCALGAVTALARATPAPARVPFDARPLKRLKAEHPSVVLIGNSMVNTRFDEAVLNQATSPVVVENLAINATRSSVWYAVLKNYVVASGVRPRVLLFFRERELTQTRAMARGPTPPALQRVMRGPDPVIAKKLGQADKDAFERLSDYLGELVPVERLRVAAWEPLDDVALGVSSSLARGPTGERRKTAINGLFAPESLRAGRQESKEASETKESFARLAARSFLPEMFALARENGISLTFLRIKTRNYAEGEPERPERARYVASLRAYVEKNGARFVDLTENDWETADLYGEGDHIAVRHRSEYTRRFVASYPELFR